MSIFGFKQIKLLHLPSLSHKFPNLSDGIEKQTYNVELYSVNKTKARFF